MVTDKRIRDFLERYKAFIKSMEETYHKLNQPEILVMGEPLDILDFPSPGLIRDMIESEREIFDTESYRELKELYYELDRMFSELPSPFFYNSYGYLHPGKELFLWSYKLDLLAEAVIRLRAEGLINNDKYLSDKKTTEIISRYIVSSKDFNLKGFEDSLHSAKQRRKSAYTDEAILFVMDLIIRLSKGQLDY